MKFFIDKRGLGGEITSFTDNIDSGLNRLMCDLFTTIGNGDMENGGKGSLWNCASEIYNCLKKKVRYGYDDCYWWMEDEYMLVKDFLPKVGWNIEQFKKYVSGWLDVDYALKNLDKIVVDRYLLWCDKPFYALNKAYNEAYKLNNKIGSTYDWLNDNPTIREIEDSLFTF